MTVFCARSCHLGALIHVGKVVECPTEGVEWITHESEIVRTASGTAEKALDKHRIDSVIDIPR